jgi:hypothetical protein
MAVDVDLAVDHVAGPDQHHELERVETLQAR